MAELGSILAHFKGRKVESPAKRSPAKDRTRPPKREDSTKPALPTKDAKVDTTAPAPNADTVEPEIVKKAARKKIERATPLPDALVPKADETIVFLTAEQQARRDELTSKKVTTIAERDELRDLNSKDPFKRYDDIEKRIEAGRSTPEDMKFKEQVEKTEDFTNRLKAKEAAEMREAVLKAEMAGLIDSHGAIEIIASKGDPGVGFENRGRKLAESAKVEDQAAGLDMQYEGLVMQRTELQSAMDDEGKPLSIRRQNKGAVKLKEVEDKLKGIKAERQKISATNPELADNQFVTMARALIPNGAMQRDDAGNVLPLKSMHDYFDGLTNLSQDLRVGYLKSWKDNGVPDTVTEIIKQALFKKETQEQKKNKKMTWAKRGGLLLMLLPALAAWSASKDRGGPGGGH